MKHNDIEELLSRRAAGTLSGSDLEELNSLAGRDEVFAQADRRVAVIRRTRRIRTTALLTIGILTTGVVMLFALPRQEKTLMAEQRTPVQVLPMEVPNMETPDAVQAAVAVEPSQECAVMQKTKERVVVRRKATTVKNEPMVVCNNSCDADSVISDIWKFLSA